MMIKPIQNIRAHIAKGQLSEAILILQSLLQHSKHLNEILLQSARHSDLKKQIRLATIDQEQAKVSKNEITLSILELLEEIEEQKASNEIVQEELLSFSANYEQQINIENSGIVSLSGNVHLEGKNVAGRDLIIDQKKKKSFWSFFKRR